MNPTSADICHANGWNVGDILEGENEVSRDRIRITAIGEAHVLARWQYTGMPESAERIVCLDFREWRKVSDK